MSKLYMHMDIVNPANYINNIEKIAIKKQRWTIKIKVF